MNEYRRWVSYLYEYVNGEKKENVGFLRVEVRGPLCRIRIGLAGDRIDRGAESRVFILADREDGVLECLLGNLPPWKISREGIFQTRSENIAGSSLPWNAFSGVRICCEERGREYRTYWDDRILKRESSRSKEKKEVVIEMKEEIKEEKAELEEEREEEIEEQGEVKEESVEETEEREVAEKEPVEEIEEQPVEVIDEQQEVIRERKWESPVRGHEPQVTWSQLQGIYPKILPFGPGDTWEVMRIGLQDIGRLPREYWVFGANEFVIHGYYDHGHLALIQDESKEFCYLGIPGYAMETDRRVAELFGFRQYRPAEQGGYWLTRIKL